jgi:hypothetical protein
MHLRAAKATSLLGLLILLTFPQIRPTSELRGIDQSCSVCEEVGWRVQIAPSSDPERSERFCTRLRRFPHSSEVKELKTRAPALLLLLNNGLAFFSSNFSRSSHLSFFLVRSPLFFLLLSCFLSPSLSASPSFSSSGPLTLPISFCFLALVTSPHSSASPLSVSHALRFLVVSLSSYLAPLSSYYLCWTARRSHSRPPRNAMA